MPRIRNYRDPTPIEIETTDEDGELVLADSTDVVAAQAAQPASDAGESYDNHLNAEGSESARSKSWLSNEVLIASLPDAKLRSAIASVRCSLRLLEAELASRLINGVGPLAPPRSARAALGSLSYFADAEVDPRWQELRLPKRKRSSRGAAKQPRGGAESKLKLLLKSIEGGLITKEFVESMITKAKGSTK